MLLDPDWSAIVWHSLPLDLIGSVERIFTADAVALVKVRGIGEKKAVRIREL